MTAIYHVRAGEGWRGGWLERRAATTTANVDSYVKTHQHPQVPGTTVVTLIVVTPPGGGVYHEVAVRDTRALDTRDWRVKVMESNLTEAAARGVFGVVKAAVMAGHRVYGIRWVDGEPDAVITRDCALRYGLIEAR